MFLLWCICSSIACAVNTLFGYSSFMVENTCFPCLPYFYLFVHRSSWPCTVNICTWYCFVFICLSVECYLFYRRPDYQEHFHFHFFGVSVARLTWDLTVSSNSFNVYTGFTLLWLFKSFSSYMQILFGIWFHLNV